MQTNALQVSRVVDLAVFLQMPIIVFDLETTTFRGRPNFGIWECAFMAAVPAGCAIAYDELMDPERKLDPEAARLCGITDGELRGKPTFAKTCLPHFLEYAPKAWFGGFNIRTFDVPAVRDMAERYERPAPEFKQLFDVRQLHHTMLATGSQKGTLVEIAASYGVHPRGELHRAKADVALTMETFDAQLGLYGQDVVLQTMLELNSGKKKRSSKKLSPAALVTYVRDRGVTNVEELAKHFTSEERAVSFEIGRAIDERLISADVFAAASVQHWLDQALPRISRDALGAGKLKGILDELRSDAPAELDYIQLRAGLLRKGLAWNTLKPA